MPTVSPDRPNAKDAVILDGAPLTIKQVAAVARNRQPVRISPEARNSMAGARAALERRMAEGEALYGINTGFGSLSRVRVADKDLNELQANLVRSHAAGVGDAVDEEVVRGMMLILSASLCRARSARGAGIFANV